VLEYTVEDLTAEEVARLRAVYEPLTQSVRELIDATIRTQVDAESVAQAKAAIDAATDRLRSSQLDGSFGIRFGTEGDQMPWGNAVIGLRNPTAPPLTVEKGTDGSVFADFHLGAAYEGPPGHVHGGVAALILDHVLGEAASSAARPRLTGTITMRYLRTTPLGPLRVEAWIDRTEGYKTYAVGHIADAEGHTVEAEGIFIQPRWARD
jgi:acyl-coenzyme A thioesterase PaaI-like protein